MFTEKLITKVRKDKKELAKSYNTDESKIVYIGDNKYIVCLPSGEQIRI